MKVGVVGQGGVGKTTVAALLARAWTQRGARVIAIDADSNPNLGLSLGLSLQEAEAVPALPRSVRIGTGEEATTVERLLVEYGALTPAGVLLLTAMRVAHAGGGGTCGSHSTVRTMLGEPLGTHADVTVVDMQAGLEHLSRAGGTLAHVDLLLVVSEPSRKSLFTAARTLLLARALGVPRVYGLGNKASLPTDERFLSIQADAHDLPLAGVLLYDDGIAVAERAGEPMPPPAPANRERIGRVIDRLEWVTLRK